MKKRIVYLFFFNFSHVLSCETLALKSYPADCHTDQNFLCFILFLFFFYFHMKMVLRAPRSRVTGGKD